MKGDVFLKPKEARRLGIMERVLAGDVFSGRFSDIPGGDIFTGR